MKLFLTTFFLIIIFYPTFGNKYQKKADSLFAKGEYKEAFIYYGDGIKNDSLKSKNSYLYLKSGDCAILLGFKQIGINYYGIATQKGCKIEDLKNHIMRYLCNNDACFYETLRLINIRFDYDKNISYEMAKIFYLRTYYNDALKILTNLEEKDSLNINLKEMIADCYFHTNDIDKALYTYINILELDEYNYDANSFLGNYYFNLAENSNMNLSTNIENYKKALTYFTKSQQTKKSDFVKNNIKKIEYKINNFYEK